MNDKSDAASDVAQPVLPLQAWDGKSFHARSSTFFASIKLAMFLFIVLAMTATIGTVIQQGERPETYVQEYGKRPTAGFSASGSPMCITPGGSPDCSDCSASIHSPVSINGFPVCGARCVRTRSVSHCPIQGMKQQTTLALDQPKETVAEGLWLFLRKRATECLRRVSGEVTVYATKGIMGRVGAHVAHLSATVIVLGGLLGSYYGFQEFGVCLEGQTYHIPRGTL